MITYHQTLFSVPESRLEERAILPLTYPVAALVVEVFEVFEEFEEQKLGLWGSCTDGGYHRQWGLLAPMRPTCLDVGFEEESRGRWGSWRVEEVFSHVVRGFRVVLRWIVLVWVPEGRQWSETSPLLAEAAPEQDIIAVVVVVVVAAAAFVVDLLCRQQQRLGESSLEHVPSL